MSYFEAFSAGYGAGVVVLGWASGFAGYWLVVSLLLGVALYLLDKLSGWWARLD